MKQNHSIEEIAKQLLDAGTVILFPHIQMDGDALGSCAALCKALRSAGKETVILVEDAVPEYLRFLDQGYCTADPDRIPDPDEMCIRDRWEADGFRQSYQYPGSQTEQMPQKKKREG